MEVLKWVLIVLAAGFVGQFGKRLADHLIARSRRRRADRQLPPSPQPPQRQIGLPDSAPSSEGSSVKVAKKAAKAEVKRSKKTAG